MLTPFAFLTISYERITFTSNTNETFNNFIRRFIFKLSNYFFIFSIIQSAFLRIFTHIIMLFHSFHIFIKILSFYVVSGLKEGVGYQRGVGIFEDLLFAIYT